MSASPARPWVIGFATFTAASALLLAERAYQGDFAVGPSLGFAGAAGAAAFLVQFFRKRRFERQSLRRRKEVKQKPGILKRVKAAITEDKAKRGGPVDQLLSEYFGIQSAEISELARRLLTAATADLIAKFAWRPAPGVRGRFILGFRNGKNPFILNLGTNGALSRGGAAMLDANGTPFQQTLGIQQALAHLSPYDLMHNPAMAALAATLALRYHEAMRSAVETSDGIPDERPGLPTILEHLSQRVIDAQGTDAIEKFKAMLDPDALETMQKLGIDNLAVYNYLAATDLFQHPDIAHARQDAVELNPAILAMIAGDPRFAAALDLQTALTPLKDLPDWLSPNGLTISFLPRAELLAQHGLPAHDGLRFQDGHPHHDDGLHAIDTIVFRVNDRNGQTLSIGEISTASDTWQMTLHPTIQDAAIASSALEAAGALAFVVDRGHEIAYHPQVETGLGLFDRNHHRPFVIDPNTIELANHSHLPELIQKPHFERDFLHDFPAANDSSRLDFTPGRDDREPDVFHHIRANHQDFSPRDLLEAIERAQETANHSMADVFNAELSPVNDNRPIDEPAIRIVTDDAPYQAPQRDGDELDRRLDENARLRDEDWMRQGRDSRGFQVGEEAEYQLGAQKNDPQIATGLEATHDASDDILFQNSVQRHTEEQDTRELEAPATSAPERPSNQARTVRKVEGPEM